MALKEALDQYNKSGRLTAAQAGYMELDGAEKDADCEIVYVEGGISKELGCCNFYQPQSMKTKQFKCGACQHVGEK